jgi:hypothetical protein
MSKKIFGFFFFFFENMFVFKLGKNNDILRIFFLLKIKVVWNTVRLDLIEVK